jgi:hypothetical protein
MRRAAQRQDGERIVALHKFPVTSGNEELPSVGASKLVVPNSVPGPLTGL